MEYPPMLLAALEELDAWFCRTGRHSRMLTVKIEHFPTTGNTYRQVTIAADAESLMSGSSEVSLADAMHEMREQD